MESGNHILNGIRCSLFVLDVFCGYSPLLVKYLVDVQHTYTTMWKGDIGWSVIYDCVVERMGGTVDRWKSRISRVWQFSSTNLFFLYDSS